MSKKVQIGEVKREEIDKVVRKLARSQGPEVVVLNKIQSRYTYKDEGKNQYQAYERFVLSNGHTIYVNLRDVEKASVSKEPDKWALGKYEKQLAKQEKRSALKAAKEAKAAERKTVKIKATTQLPIIPFDPKASTLPEPKRSSKFTQEQADRIDAIMEHRGCTRPNAIKVLHNEEAIKAADAKA